MNKTYRLKWNERTQHWVVVSELAPCRGKRSSGTLLLAAAAGIISVSPTPTFAAPPNPPAATALPTGGQLVAGQATITQNQATMNITQDSHRAIIDWSSFNVGSQAQVNFVQPSTSAATLNRVQDPNPSQIFGRITANGQVFLTNASGIYFSPGSSVNVGALTATTHSIGNDDFMAGNYRFSRNGAEGSIENEGHLAAELGGYIALLAPEVRNNGIVIARMGTVVHAAGESYELQFDADRLAGIRVEPATIAALVENGNAVQAPGGLVILSAQAADRLQGGVVNNAGSIEATGLVNDGGTVRLLASDTLVNTGAITVDAAPAATGSGGTALLVASFDNPQSTAQISGTISARGSARGGDGGFVETSAARVEIDDGFRVDTLAPQGKTGQWLLDPVDITIAASGGNVTGAAIATALATTDVTLDTAGAGTCSGVACGGLGGTNGDITINDNITVTGGSADTTLTLKAAGDIVMNAGKTIDASGNGSSKVDVVFNADSDASAGGYIWMKASGGTGASIRTNGGNLTLSGGLDVDTGYAEGDTTTMSNGVLLDSTTLNTSGGDIVIRGKSATAGSAAYATSDSNSMNNADGVRLAGSNTIDSGVGTIDIQGVARGSNSASNGIETNFAGYSKILSAATNTTAINLNGSATGGTSGLGWGTFLWGTNTSGIVLGATGANGGISLNGQGRNVANGGGTHLEPNAFVLAASGPISITGTKGAASTFEDVVINSTVGFVASLPAGFGISSPVTASSSNITIASDTLSANRIFGGGSLTGSAVQSSGTLTLKPRTTGNALSIQTTAPASGSWINPNAMFGASGLFKTGFSKLIFGSATTGNVTLNNYTFDNDTDLLTGGNAVLGNLTIATRTLTVDVTGGGSITDSGAVAVSKLKLNGATTAATLDTATNAIGTVAANVASLSLLNGSALTIGAAGGTNGVTASGQIDIATKSGNLTVSQNVTTANTSANAIRLNAGRDASAGTSTGGNLIISGSPTLTTGVNGYTTLYSGSVSGSTGLTTLVGSGSGRFRYNSDETASNYSTALVAGKNAIYREQPAITTTANADSKPYDGLAYSGGNGATSSGFVNGDSEGALSGTLTYGGTSQGAIDVGTYTITPGGLANGLGYALAYASGTLTINPAALTLLTVTANNLSKLYGSLYTFSGQEFTSVGLVGGETIGSVTLTSAGAPASASVGSYEILASNATGGTFDPGNYDITYVNGLLTVNKAPLTITANDASKTHDGIAYAGGNGVTYSGFVNGETSAVLGGNLTYGGNSQGASPVGVYAIQPQGLTANNYAIETVSGRLQIAPVITPPPIVNSPSLPGPTTSAQPLQFPVNDGSAGSFGGTPGGDTFWNKTPGTGDPNLGGSLGGAAVGGGTFWTATPASASEATTASVATVATLTVAQIAAMSEAQIKAITRDQMMALSIDQINAFTSDQRRYFSGSQSEWWTTRRLMGLTPAEIGALSSKQLTYMTVERLELLSTEQINAFSTLQLLSIDPAKIASVSKDKAKTYNDVAIARAKALTADQIRRLTPKQINALTVNQIKAMSMEQLNAFSVDIARHLGKSQYDAAHAMVAATKAAAINAAPASNIQSLDVTRTPPLTFGGLDASHVKALSVKQVQAMSFARILALSNNVTSNSMDVGKDLDAAIKSAAINAARNMSDQDIRDLIPAQIGSMPKELIAVLSKESLAKFSQEQLQALSSSQIKSLTDAQLSKLTPLQRSYLQR